MVMRTTMTYSIFQDGGPDYGDPKSYLDTFLPDYAGYVTKSTWYLLIDSFISAVTN